MCFELYHPLSLHRKDKNKKKMKSMTIWCVLRLLWTERNTFQDFRLFLWYFLDIWNVEWISVSRSLEKGRFYYQSIKITLFICRTLDQQRVVRVESPNENNSLRGWPATSESSLARKCDCLGISQHIIRLIFNISHSCVDT